MPARIREQRVTSTETGASYDADAGGTAVVDYGTDGAQTWRWIGPVLVGSGGHATGLYLLDGVYETAISPTGRKDLTFGHGSEIDVCAQSS